MKTIMRPRHYCDHCKKSGGRKDIIASHEASCTANPNRVCGCCRIAANKQPTIEQMREALSRDYVPPDVPIADDYDGPDIWSTHGDMKHLREVTKGCPACILAAFRQLGAAASFDFQKEMAAWMEQYGQNHDDIY